MRPAEVLLSSLLFVALASNGHTQVEVMPGQNATLQCRSPTDAEITLLEWSRPELKSSGYVFFYRNQRPYEKYQHESFRGRVQLRDPNMKDGDVSVVLRNVSVRDAGTYECEITTSSFKGAERVTEEFQHFIILTVTASASQVKEPQSPAWSLRGGGGGAEPLSVTAALSVCAVLVIM